MSEEKDVMVKFKEEIKEELIDCYVKGVLFAADSVKTKSPDEFQKIVESAKAWRKDFELRLRQSGAPIPNTQNCKNCKRPTHVRLFGDITGAIRLKESFDESATDGDFVRKAHNEYNDVEKAIIAAEDAETKELEAAKKLADLVLAKPANGKGR